MLLVVSEWIIEVKRRAKRKANVFTKSIQCGMKFVFAREFFLVQFFSRTQIVKTPQILSTFFKMSRSCCVRFGWRSHRFVLWSLIERRLSSSFFVFCCCSFLMTSTETISYRRLTRFEMKRKRKTIRINQNLFQHTSSRKSSLTSHYVSLVSRLLSQSALFCFFFFGCCRRTLHRLLKWWKRIFLSPDKYTNFWKKHLNDDDLLLIDALRIWNSCVKKMIDVGRIIFQLKS